ncbi:MAG: hypothetical protein IT556_13475, partial [Acetobacteraceae bacterium]|nr:hypothetical protein [Acetobacteraceae bacterium]
EAETNARPRAGSGNGGGAPGATPAADVIPASNGNAPGPSGAAPGAASSITPGSPPSVSASATSAAADPQAIAAIAAEIRRIVCVTVQQAPLRRGQKNSNRFVGEVCNAPPVRIAASATRR